MENEKRQSYETQERRYLENIGERYIFNQSSGLYEAQTRETELVRQETSEHTENAPLEVRVLRDWLVFCVSVATLLLLVATVIYTEIAAHSAQSAADTAQKTLSQNIEAFRIDERAWVEIEPIKPVLLDNTPKFGATFTCDIYPKNVGKTVATSVVVKAVDEGAGEGFADNASVMAGGQDKFLLDQFTEMKTDKRVHVPQNPVPKVLAPNTTSPAPFRLTCQPPMNGMFHYLIGRVDYCDQFKVRHWMKFCYYVVNARGEIWDCQAGNDEDSNPETTPDRSCMNR